MILASEGATGTVTPQHHYRNHGKVEMSTARDEWLLKLARRAAPPRLIRDALSPELTAAGGVDITGALVVCFISHQHARGRLLESITGWLRHAQVLTPNADALDVAMEAISIFRAGRLPFDRWWNPDLLTSSFIELWAYAASERHDRAAVHARLETVWWVDRESVDALLGGRPCPPQIGDFLDDWSAREDGVADMLASSDIEAAGRDAIGSLPEFAEGNDELIEFARWVGVLRLVQRVVGEIRDGMVEIVPPGLLAFSEEFQILLRAHFDRFTAIELSLLNPPSEAETVLRRHVVQRDYVITGFNTGHAMVHGLPDRMGPEHTIITDWLDDQVFSAGGRSGIGERGPTPHIWIALEPHELPEGGHLPGIAFGLLEPDQYPVHFSVNLGPSTDALGITFPAGHGPRTRRFLAMLLLTGRILIDVFAIDPDRGLVLLYRFADEPTALIDVIRDRVVDLLRNTSVAEFDPAQIYDDHVVAGFMASENAKSELLLSLAEGMLGPDRQLRAARDQFLAAQARRVALLYDAADTTAVERDVDSARVVLGEAWGHVRSERAGTLAPDRHEQTFRDSVAGVTTDTRAVIHYNLHSGHLQAYWTFAGGAERGMLLCEDVDLQAISDAIEPWMRGERGDVDALISVSESLVPELYDALEPLGIQELVILPWAVLQSVPFAALPLGGRVLSDAFAISYSPSVALLRMGTGSNGTAQQARDRTEFVSAHGGSLRWADPEVRAAAALQSTTATTDATRDDILCAIGRGRIVHLASHGLWWRDDHFASVLDLRRSDPVERYISAADVHRQTSLAGAELVLLSACDTGRSPTTRRYIESYTGLDAAFLVKGAKAVVSSLWPVNDLAALLFMTWLHRRLIVGDSVSGAFHDSVRMLRRGGIDLLDDPVAAPILDQVAAGWRTARDAAAGQLTLPRTWATFKLSGPHWVSSPQVSPEP